VKKFALTYCCQRMKLIAGGSQNIKRNVPKSEWERRKRERESVCFHESQSEVKGRGEVKERMEVTMIFMVRSVPPKS